MPNRLFKKIFFQDKAELGCLRAIVLFNPDAKGLEAAASAQVESFREKVYATLEEYTRLNNENEPSRRVCGTTDLCTNQLYMNINTV